MHAVTRRDNKWDFIKGMLIVFVVWGHLCSYISNSSAFNELTVSEMFIASTKRFSTSLILSSVHAI